MQWIRNLIWITAIVFALLNPRPARSAELDDVALELCPQVAALLRRAVPPPDIVWVNDRQIFEQCRCQARALFVEGGVRVNLSVDAQSKEGRAVIVHELVHWAQWLEHGNAMDCADWLAREGEAVAIERRWRSEHGARLPPPPQYRCTNWR